jgi:hypothetical protein
MFSSGVDSRIKFLASPTAVLGRQRGLSRLEGQFVRSKTAEPFRVRLFVNCCFDFGLVIHAARRHRRSRDCGIPFQESPPSDVLSAEDATQIGSVFVTELILSAVSQM